MTLPNAVNSLFKIPRYRTYRYIQVYFCEYISLFSFFVCLYTCRYLAIYIYSVFLSLSEKEEYEILERRGI